MSHRMPPSPWPIDPELPDGFYTTPNDERSTAELDEWWDHPYLTTQKDGSFVVRCLDGGAWDRPTVVGFGVTAEEATADGLLKIERWKSCRSKPMVQFEGDKAQVVIMAQRPDQDVTVLASGLTFEQANDFIESFDQSKSPEA